MLTNFPRDAENQSPHVYHKHGPIIIGVNCMMAVVCLIAIIGRWLARRMKKLGLQADDYFAFIAYVADHFWRVT